MPKVPTSPHRKSSKPPGNDRTDERATPAPADALDQAEADRRARLTGDDDPWVVGANQDGDTDGRPEITPAVPRARASVLATVGLVVGVVAALLVLSGTLAGYGIALGVIGIVLSVFGLLATQRQHIVGKGDALLGLGLAAAAVTIGVLALIGGFVWPTTDGDWALRFRDWLDAQVVDRF